MEQVKRSRYYGINALRFLLMPFVCFACFGLPGRVGGIISNLSMFAAPTFFILCGFFHARNERTGTDKNTKVLRRTALRFLALFALFLLLNLALYLIQIGIPLKTLLAALVKKRTLFEFVVLCVWPFAMGRPIWFIQSLLYVRFGLWLMNKWKLMRLEKPLMVLGFLAMLLTSELAGLVHFQVLGYRYLTTNWLTCALPYILLGRIAYEKREKLRALSTKVCIIGFVLGAALAFGEFSLLSYFGYLVYAGNSIGFGVMAMSAFCLFLKKNDMKRSFLAAHGRSYAWRIYVLNQPVGLLVLLFASFSSAALLSAVQQWSGVIVYVLCLLISFVFGYILHFTKIQNDSKLMRKWNRWLH